MSENNTRVDATNFSKVQFTPDSRINGKESYTHNVLAGVVVNDWSFEPIVTAAMI